MDIVVKGIYKHFKGDYYFVEEIATHSETGEKLVIYRALYGDTGLYARPYDMFIGEVDLEKYPDAKQKYRFELQSIKSVKESLEWNLLLDTNQSEEREMAYLPIL